MPPQPTQRTAGLDASGGKACSKAGATCCEDEQGSPSRASSQNAPDDTVVAEVGRKRSCTSRTSASATPIPHPKRALMHSAIGQTPWCAGAAQLAAGSAGWGRRRARDTQHGRRRHTDVSPPTSPCSLAYQMVAAAPRRVSGGPVGRCQQGRHPPHWLSSLSQSILYTCELFVMDEKRPIRLFTPALTDVPYGWILAGRKERSTNVRNRHRRLLDRWTLSRIPAT